MAWTYKPLWHLLIDRGMKRIDLLEKTGINAAALTKLGKDEPVHLKVLGKICEQLDCRIEDVVAFVPDEAESSESDMA